MQESFYSEQNDDSQQEVKLASVQRCRAVTMLFFTTVLSLCFPTLYSPMSTERTHRGFSVIIML